MITVFTGTPGCGKTLSAVKECQRWKGTLITNIDLVGGREFYKLPENPQDIIEICRQHSPIKENQTLIVIDEAQMIFNCRQWSRNDRTDWIFFFTHHRKFGAKILLITQSLSFLDKQLRQLIEFEYNYRRMSRWGWLGALLYFLTFGEKYLYVDYYVPSNERLGIHISLIGKKYYKYYSTFEIPNDQQAESVGLLCPPMQPAADAKNKRALLLDYILTTRFFKVGKNVLLKAKTLWQLLINKVYKFPSTIKDFYYNSGYVTKGTAKTEEEFWRQKLSQQSPGEGQFDIDYIIEPVELD